MNEGDRQELVALLSALRRDGRQQSGLEARLVPPDVQVAYEVAGLVAQRLGWDVVGWKIAAFKPEMQRALRASAPIYGRVFAPHTYPSPHTVRFDTQCSPIPEAEFMVRLRTDLPPRDDPYTLEEITEATASLHVGLELAECRFVHDADFPPLPAILADGSGGGRLVLGPEIVDWQSRPIAEQEVVLYCDGVARRRGSAAAALEHPMQPVLWLANELSRTGVGLWAGQLISTGTLTGMLAPKPGQTFLADFGEFGQVTATYAE
ncbi:MAG: fumarylacetoacetate hydrolase family protein [Pseudomonadota bacterium]